MTTSSRPTSARVAPIGWAVLAALCALYAGFAALAAVGWVEAGKSRALPGAFTIHAVAGAVVLIAGAVQFNPAVRRRRPGLHRGVGRVYGVAVGLASATGVLSAAVFDAPPAARVSFIAAGTLWFGATLIAWRRILRRDVAGHAAWMTRSFALSLFFISFSLWTPLMAASSLPEPVAYTAGVTLGWVGNLIVAEALIRRRRAPA